MGAKFLFQYVNCAMWTLPSRKKRHWGVLPKWVSISMFVLLRLKSIVIIIKKKLGQKPNPCVRIVYLDHHTILTCSLQNNIVSRGEFVHSFFIYFCVLPFGMVSVFNRSKIMKQFMCGVRGLIRRARHSHAAHSDRKWTCSCARALTHRGTHDER